MIIITLGLLVDWRNNTIRNIYQDIINITAKPEEGLYDTMDNDKKSPSGYL